MTRIIPNTKWATKNGGAFTVLVVAIEGDRVSYDTIERFGRRPTSYEVAEPTFRQNFEPVAVRS